MHEPTEDQRQAAIRQNELLNKAYSEADRPARWLCTICWHDSAEAEWVPEPPELSRVSALRCQCEDCDAVTLVQASSV
jgi:hypothetical protein